MKLSFRNRILIAMAFVGCLCTGVSMYFSTRQLSNDLEQALIEKSRAILSRVEQSAHYVAEMDVFKGIVNETVKNYPQGNIPDAQKLKILKGVPIYAAFQIGQQGADKEHYQFRIASDSPRNKDNQANSTELEVISKFRADSNLKEQTYKSADGSTISVVAPVRIAESRNCLACHGDPANSPWKNGHDVLGYKMENMHDGDLKATFAIVSSLEPVHAAVRASVRDTLIFGISATLLALLAGFFFVRRPIEALAALARRVSGTSAELSSASASLASSSQQLASSAQEQASSVEETSSSLEEISGMVSSALKGSEQSVDLSHKVSELVNSGSESMSQLQSSVNQIAEANARVEKLAKLIEEIGEKTELIDEIVFQTRLLSFNASVEAERAGEHGRGFAVVAQEVGNLAQMSGKSASEIGQIVKNSMKEARDVVELNRNKVEQGVALCRKTAEQLESIEKASKEILKGAEQVLRSSEEQNSGIQQINQSIQLISQATQENASSAEQISSNSQTLTQQEEKLAYVVGDLEALVYGNAKPREELKTESQSPAKRHEFKKKKGKVVAIKETSHKAQPKPKTSATTGNLALKDQEDPWEKL